MAASLQYSAGYTTPRHPHGPGFSATTTVPRGCQYRQLHRQNRRLLMESFFPSEAPISGTGSVPYCLPWRSNRASTIARSAQRRFWGTPAKHSNQTCCEEEYLLHTTLGIWETITLGIWEPFPYSRLYPNGIFTSNRVGMVPLDKKETWDRVKPPTAAFSQVKVKYQHPHGTSLLRCPWLSSPGRGER